MRKSARLASMSRKFCAKLARRNCKISGNPARRAHKNCVHSASEGCACSINVAEDVRVDNAFRSEKNARSASRSRECCAKIARKKCKIFENFQRAARTKSCVHSACVRFNSHDIFDALHQVMSALTSEQTRVRRRDHANFAPKSREKIAKFLEFRRTARTKFACSRPTYVEQIAEPRCSSSPSRQCVEM